MQCGLTDHTTTAAAPSESLVDVEPSNIIAILIITLFLMGFLFLARRLFASLCGRIFSLRICNDAQQFRHLFVAVHSKIDEYCVLITRNTVTATQAASG